MTEKFKKIKTNKYARYIWLLQTIQNHRRLTKSEIDSIWRNNDRINPDGEDCIPERTFHRYRQKIADIFEIDIECDHSTGEYYLANNNSGSASLQKWLINTFSVNSLIGNNPDLRSRILFEDIPMGSNHLTTIVEAMRDNSTITFTYANFYDEPIRPTLDPLCVKIFKRRWYVIARTHGKKTIKHYSLDRIDGRIVTNDEKFTYPSDFSPQEYFSDVYGVRHHDFYADHFGNKKCKVIIRVDDEQRKYFETLPFHHSQKIIDETEEYVDIQYNLIPNYEFVQELFAQSQHIEVIYPIELRELMTDELYYLFNRYLYYPEGVYYRLSPLDPRNSNPQNE